jgi:hypothetical protein
MTKAQWSVALLLALAAAVQAYAIGTFLVYTWRIY